MSIKSRRYSGGTSHSPVETAKSIIGRFVAVLDNKLRNAINHYKTKLHHVEQRIEYFPYKGVKKANTSENIFLIDLTERCYWQFQAIYDLLYIIGALHCFKYD